MDLILKWLPVVVFSLGVIYIILEKQKEKESYYALKVIGYYFLGAFRFSFNAVHLPLGFVVFLLFLRNPKQNQEGKRYAAILGLIVFLLSIIIPVATELHYERTRYTEKVLSNIYQMDFKEQWLQVANEMELDELALRTSRVERVHLNYERDGQIKTFRYELVWRDGQQFHHAYIDYNVLENNLHIRPTKISKWLQYDSLMLAEETFRRLNEVDIEGMTEKLVASEGSFYSFYGIDQGTFGVTNARLLISDKGELVPFAGELPVQCSWVSIYEMRPSGPNSFSSANSLYYLFNVQN